MLCMSLLENLAYLEVTKIDSIMLYFRNFIALVFMFRPMIHLELIFVCEGRDQGSFW